MKTYKVYFNIKMNSTEYLADAEVEAKNSKEACKAVKDWFKKETGRNAFTPSTTAPSDAWIAKKEAEGATRHFGRIAA